MKYGLIITFLASVSAFSQVPNGGFENWTDCTPDFWASPSTCGVLEPVTKSAQSHSGSFAVRGEVISFFGQNISAFVQSGEDGNGFPIWQRYSTVNGFYIFNPIGGDRFGGNIIFYKGETVVAQGAALFPASATYAPFSISMTYMTQDVPDRAILQFQIIGPVTGSDYHAGSVMFLDDVTFDSGGGTSAEPRLEIVLNQDRSSTVRWPSEVTGFRLQTSTSLNPQAWSDVQGLAATDRAYTFTPTSQRYFRLFKP